MAINYSKQLPRRKQVVAHALVAKTAEEMANEVYEEMAKTNEFYAAYPTRKAWVDSAIPRFVEYARKSLAELLSKPGFPEDQKEVIYNALVLDGSLPRHRGLH
jgi:hypothetical protein